MYGNAPFASALASGAGYREPDKNNEGFSVLSLLFGDKSNTEGVSKTNHSTENQSTVVQQKRRSPTRATPVINSINPNIGSSAGGDRVTITGNNLGDQRVGFAQISTGHYVSCALSFAGQAYCWGKNNNGQ